MIANIHLPHTAHESQITHQKRYFSYFQAQVDHWSNHYQDYLVDFNSEEHFKWLVHKAFLDPSHHFDQKNHAKKIDQILSHTLETTLSQNVLWAARLMAWENDDFWPWVEEFAIEIVEQRVDRVVDRLPKAVCKTILKQTIGLRSITHAYAWYAHCCGSPKKPTPWTDRLRSLEEPWYYPDYMSPSDALPNNAAYGERLYLSAKRLLDLTL